MRVLVTSLFYSYMPVHLKWYLNHPNLPNKAMDVRMGFVGIAPADSPSNSALETDLTGLTHTSIFGNLYFEKMLVYLVFYCLKMSNDA